MAVSKLCLPYKSYFISIKDTVFSRINTPSQIIAPPKIQNGLNTPGVDSKDAFILRETNLV